MDNFRAIFSCRALSGRETTCSVTESVRLRFIVRTPQVLPLSTENLDSSDSLLFSYSEITRCKINNNGIDDNFKYRISRKCIGENTRKTLETSEIINETLQVERSRRLRLYLSFSVRVVELLSAIF